MVENEIARPAERTRAPAEPSTAVGRWLRHERELRQISLEELSLTTRIPMKMLQHLEEDRHDQLPGDVFARGFLKSYARAVGLAESEVVDRWNRARKAPAEPQATPAASITPPERSRRFGIAIALVILLILFTLALSIVLRPRHRDTPVELSSVTVVAADASAS
jgi:cytoskeletal protein RodZ